MSKMYSFSYNVGVRTPVVVRRKWWNLFGKDKVEFVEHSTRKRVTDITIAEADILIGPLRHGPTISLIEKIIGPSSYWQLEELFVATRPYISTTAPTNRDEARQNGQHKRLLQGCGSKGVAGENVFCDSGNGACH